MCVCVCVCVYIYICIHTYIQGMPLMRQGVAVTASMNVVEAEESWLKSFSVCMYACICIHTYTCIQVHAQICMLRPKSHG
jgi:hypothetical protein